MLFLFACWTIHNLKLLQDHYMERMDPGKIFIQIFHVQRSSCLMQLTLFLWKRWPQGVAGHAILCHARCARCKFNIERGFRLSSGPPLRCTNLNLVSINVNLLQQYRINLVSRKYTSNSGSINLNGLITGNTSCLPKCQYQIFSIVFWNF